VRASFPLVCTSMPTMVRSLVKSVLELFSLRVDTPLLPVVPLVLSNSFSQSRLETLCLVVDARHDVFGAMSDGLVELRPHVVYCDLHLLYDGTCCGCFHWCKGRPFKMMILCSFAYCCVNTTNVASTNSYINARNIR
jgi:hypothetical protein